MTHVEALDLDRLPEHVIVLGGGYVGLELAQALRRFGSAVTIIERGRQIAAAEDQDIAQALLENFTSEGIEVFLDARVNEVGGLSGQKVRVGTEDAHGQRTIEGTDLLVATGRTPNTQGIGLETAGVELDARGYIKVNEKLETGAPGVWAIGDGAGESFVHARRFQRFPGGPRQPEWGQPHYARPARPLLYVHGSRTRTGRLGTNLKRSDGASHIA